MTLQYAPVRKVYWNLSHQQKARSAYLPPGEVGERSKAG